MNRIILLTTGILILASCSSNPNKVNGGIENHPNIILVYTDDQGYGDVSSLNPESRFQTPNMDRLIKEGMFFSDAHCTDAVCSPSRYGLLTGRYSWRTELKKGVLGAEGEGLIENGRVTLASLLRDHGYHTAMVGKWHLNIEFPGEKGERDWSQPITDGPVNKGFDYFFGIAASMNYGMLTYIENDRVTEIPSMWTRKKKDPEAVYRMMPPYDMEPAHKSDLEVAPGFLDSEVLKIFTDKAVQYIHERAADNKEGQPFFLYLPYTSPHLPLCPAEVFIGKSEIGLYGDFMMETDYRLGQVLDALDENGLTENTLVIFSSDNGPESIYHERIDQYGHYSNWKLKGGKRDIYEGGHRVPFLVRWPDVIEAGRQCSEPVSQADLLATFADILGVSLPDNAGEDSYSILPAFIGEEYPIPVRGPLVMHSFRGYFSIREGDWKLNLFRGSGGSLKPVLIEPVEGEPVFELYNMKTDWQETTNLYDEYPEVVERLKNTMTEYVINGRSTQGEPQENDGPAHWNQLIWMNDQ